MKILNLTSPNNTPVVVVIGMETAVVVPHQFKPQGEFLVGKTAMIEGSRIMAGPRMIDVLETVKQVAKAMAQPDADSLRYQIASDQ